MPDLHSNYSDPSLTGETIDLSNCDREPIHLLSTIQPIGFLVAASADWIITRLSANAPDWLGQPVDALLGSSLRTLFSAEALHTLRNRQAVLRGDDAVERAFALRLMEGGPAFDVAIHLSAGQIVLECEPSERDGDMSAGTLVRSLIARLQPTEAIGDFYREAARLLRALTGFDRVMVYKFTGDGSGEVVADATKPGIPSFLGLRYPASDIPKQARALYERNWLRIVADTSSEGVPIVPQLGPEGEPLDLSMSTLRAVSPIHLEYLRNMGVAASMSVSILRRGKLWGLFACHHLTPRCIAYERRSAAELYGQTFSLLLESRERELEVDYETRARKLHNQLMAAMAAGASTFENISRFVDSITDLIPCDGIGIWVEEQVTLKGTTPTREEFLGLTRFLNRTGASSVFATNEIGKAYEPGRDFPERAAGLLAIPVSRSPRDYIVFFRREVARSVTWAGNPDKPVTVGPNGVRLTPRKSFDAWREVLHGQSLPWTDAELRVANSLRTTLLEVILHLADIAQKERQGAAERQELLIAELNHRVRNILGLIRGLISQSQAGSGSVEEFAGVLSGRVQALARAHDQITRDQWGPASLRALIEAEAEAYAGDGTGGFNTGGRTGVCIGSPDVLLQPEAFTTVVLVLHELMTNSAKYGALQGGRGQVNITWMQDASGRLVIQWVESGGPPVQAPTRRGFGTTIIERSIPHDLKGEATVEFLLAGLRARLVIPAHYVAAGHPAAAPPAMPASRPPARLSGAVLLVEDNIIIALDAEEMLAKMGATQVDVAGSVADALASIGTHRPDFAVLDVNLGGETSFAVASRLQILGIPHVFATGYGEDVAFPPEHAGTPVAKKPYSVASLQAVVAALAKH
jgi:light-regulated signal transduction histidine kinase (bacteriophytochrome)/CheY-like chemotaxis protein